ncbi:cytochrome P450 [Streptomyces sp. NPDC060085]|uniref:cytochrome P450 n=1 Tax=Streptomyces sp. NPDC060085 TaxID=3347054 RepID=UPI0036567910
MDREDGWWVIKRHSDVSKYLSDDRLTPLVDFPTAPSGTYKSSPALVSALHQWCWMRQCSLDSISLNRLRPHFSHRHLRNIETRIQTSAQRHAENLHCSGGGDVVLDYVTPLVGSVMADFSRLPSRDSSLITECSVRRWAMFDARGSKLETATRVKFHELEEKLIESIDFTTDRREIVNGSIPLLPPNETRNFRIAQFTAAFTAYELARAILSTTLSLLLHNPHQLARVRGNPEITNSLIKEVLRLHGPEYVVPMKARIPFEIHGNSIEVGDCVALAAGSANCDSSIFMRPAVFSPDRTVQTHIGLSSPYARLTAPLVILIVHTAVCTLLRSSSTLSLASTPVSSNERPPGHRILTLPVRYFN